MTTDLYLFATLYRRLLDVISHLLDKGEAHAAGLGEAEAPMLDWRLIDDMQPLRFQVAVVVNFARQWPARGAGLPVPEAIDAGLSLAGLREALAEAKTDLDRLTPDQFAGRSETPLTVELGNGMIPTLPAGQWIANFATTNLYFHASIVYAILRAKGVPIGKIDLFPTGL